MKNAILNKIKRYYQFFKFCITGVLNTLISTISYWIMLKIGVYYILANVISYFIGMINSYILNKKWVFKSKDSPIKTFLKFFSVSILALGLSTLILYSFVHFLKLNAFIAQILTTGIIMIFNYILSKFFTFKKAKA